MEQNTFHYAMQSCSPTRDRGGMILGKVTRGLKHVHLEEKRSPHCTAHRPLLPHICRAALPHLLTSSTCRPLFLQSRPNRKKANRPNRRTPTPCLRTTPIGSITTPTAVLFSLTATSVIIPGLIFRIWIPRNWLLPPRRSPAATVVKRMTRICRNT